MKNTDLSVLLQSKCGGHHKFHTQNHPEIGMKEVKVMVEAKGQKKREESRRMVEKIYSINSIGGIYVFRIFIEVRLYLVETSIQQESCWGVTVDEDLCEWCLRKRECFGLRRDGRKK